MVKFVQMGQVTLTHQKYPMMRKMLDKLLSISKNTMARLQKDIREEGYMKMCLKLLLLKNFQKV